MPEIVKLGPFIVRSSWLILLVGGWLGFQLMKRRLDRDHVDPNPIMDMFSTILVILALSWKLGPIILNPSMLLENPWTALFMPGTKQHVLIGGVIAVIYLAGKLKKLNLSHTILLDVLPFGILSILIPYHLLIPHYGAATTLPWGISILDHSYSYHPVGLYLALVEIPLLAWLWKRKNSLGSSRYASQFFFVYGVTGMLVSFFEEYIPFIGGMSTSQWLFLLMASVGVLMLPNQLIS